MKTIYKVFCAICIICGLWACSDDNTSNLKLKGDCMVETIELDGYEGIVDLTSRTITVRLPEIYDASAMEVTSLKLSDGARCNLHQGDILNMNEAKDLIVKNGDVQLNWTLCVLNDEAKIYQFYVNEIYQGAIDQDAKTITIYVPATVDITTLIPTITLSPNATVNPGSGVTQDFSEPVEYTVTNNSAESTYMVTVIAIEKPHALFVGSASTMNDLDPEAKAACQWMLGNISNSLYASFADLRSGTIDLSECKVIWWHWHVDGGVDGHDVFAAKATDALETKNVLRQFYENGGAFFFTRYATNMPSFIGVTGDDEWTTPNNCWGQNEDAAELCGGPWSFRIFDGQTNHALWQNLVAGENAQEVYCTDAGYHITNSTAQYHIGTDWGGYDNHAAWENRTGGKILGVGGDGAVVAWEYPANAGKGGIICIGSGCYDWYSYTYEAGYTEKFHKNIEIITKNAFDYLMQ
jgi:hypothetical protein